MWKGDTYLDNKISGIVMFIDTTSLFIDIHSHVSTNKYVSYRSCCVFMGIIKVSYEKWFLPINNIDSDLFTTIADLFV